jgi:hypothetical protein
MTGDSANTGGKVVVCPRCQARSEDGHVACYFWDDEGRLVVHRGRCDGCQEDALEWRCSNCGFH